MAATVKRTEWPNQFDYPDHVVLIDAQRIPAEELVTADDIVNYAVDRNEGRGACAWLYGAFLLGMICGVAILFARAIR
jgi:hypothetical protein